MKHLNDLNSSNRDPPHATTEKALQEFPVVILVGYLPVQSEEP